MPGVAAGAEVRYLGRMYPLLLTLTAPGPLLDVRVADADGDGVQELVLATAAGPGPGPTGLVLTVLEVGQTGETGRRTWTLPPEAAWWDAGHGLWAVDGEGLRRIDGERVATVPTALSGLGPTTPTQATLVRDLDRDGTPELLVWCLGEVRVLGADGIDWGGVPTPLEGVLSPSSESGGQVLSVSHRSPPVAAGDVDGDGVDDLIVIRADHLDVHHVRAGKVGVDQQRWPLPAVLQPPPIGQSDDEAWATDVRWADLTGDGRVDLLVHRVRSDDTLAGTQAELHLLAGTGAGLGPAQVIATGAGSAEAHPVDLDGDGDLDVVLPQVDLDVTNLAQAVFTRSVDVKVVALPMVDGVLGEPLDLKDIAVDLESSDAAWSFFQDLDGDGLVDLAVALGGELRCLKGGGLSLAEKPWFSRPLPVPVTRLWAQDLTGDGAAELIGWAPGQTELLVVRLR